MKLRSFFAGIALGMMPFAPSHSADAEALPRVGLKVFAEGFVSPAALVPLPGTDGAVLVADQAGVVYRVNKNGERAETPFLDLRKRLIKLNNGFDERGLLCIALPPNFGANKKFYVVYTAPKRPTAPVDWDNTLRHA